MKHSIKLISLLLSMALMTGCSFTNETSSGEQSNQPNESSTQEVSSQPEESSQPSANSSASSNQPSASSSAQQTVS